MAGAGVVAGCFVKFDNSGTEFVCSDGQTCPSGLVCIDNVCRDPDFVPPDAAVDADPPIDPLALIGDIVTYSFDPVQDSGNMVLDGSGRRLHANKEAPYVPGRFGSGVSFDSATTGAQLVFIPTEAALFTSKTLTLEMWVNRNLGDVEMPLFGDVQPAGTPPVTYLLSIGADNNLAFTTNSGCPSDAITVTAPASTIAVAEWVHVAVTWDGANASFYVNGALTDTVPLAVTPCSALADHWLIGARDDDLFRFDGIIDELKFSSYVKTDVEIAASMSHDTSALNDQCGNGVVIAGQSCEPGGLCCDNACAPLGDGQPCESGSTDVCMSGVCQVGGGRTATNLIALYLFNEGAGVTVTDSSGVGAPVNLTIADENLITWGASFLEITQAVPITSGAPATKIIDAARLSNEVSFEAWVTPANTTQTGPARIVSISTDASLRDFTMGQEASAFVGRVTSTSTNGNGTPPAVASGVASTGLTHIVVTTGRNGFRRVYVDGVLVGVTRSSGVFANWDTGMQMSLGDEITGARLWTGRLHLVAVYDRELSASEVAANFLAGPD